MAKVVIAIDQGTTGSTVLAFDPSGQVVARAYSEFPQIYPQPGWVEHDPEVIWTTTESVLRSVLQNVDGVAAVGITNQRETTVIWDRKTGRPIHNAIVWQCRRTADLCAQLRPQETVFRERTGLVMDAYFSGTKVRWLLDNVPKARARAEAGDLCFGTIDSWLIWKLTGGATHLTDHTNASRTLMYNIHHKDWDQDLLERLDIPSALLPKIVSSSEVMAHTHPDSAFGAEVPIAGIAGDQQAALYGQRCYAPGMAKNTYGTGCFLMMFHGDAAVSSQNGLLTTIACAHDGSPAYALEGSVFIAGAAVQWLRDELGLVQSAAETDAIAKTLKDNNGVYLVPAFAGLGAPYWDMQARGALVGLTRGAGRVHIVRAALESIAYQSRDVLEAMRADTGQVIPQLRVDGGASNNDFLMQFQADQLGVPIRRGDHAEMTAFGAALLAGRAVNFWEDHLLPDDPRNLTGSGEVFQPEAPQADSDLLYDGWKRAVASVRTN